MLSLTFCSLAINLLIKVQHVEPLHGRPLMEHQDETHRKTTEKSELADSASDGSHQDGSQPESGGFKQVKPHSPQKQSTTRDNYRHQHIEKSNNATMLSPRYTRDCPTGSRLGVESATTYPSDDLMQKRGAFQLIDSHIMPMETRHDDGKGGKSYYIVILVQDQTNNLSVSRTKSPTAQIVQSQLYTPDSTDMMDFTTPLDFWRPDVEAQPNTQPLYGFQETMNSRRPPHLPQGVRVTPPNTSVPRSTHSVTTSPRMEGVDKRFEFVLDCARTSGFKNFDSLVTAYYNSSFDNASSLAHEQRLSRNRGLPRVISDVFQAADNWSDWERRGFYEEILRMTESMLTSESQDARDDAKNSSTPWLKIQNETNGSYVGQAVTAMKRSIENDVLGFHPSIRQAPLLMLSRFLIFGL